MIDHTKPLIALRSLRSEHHAQHKDPKILMVTWHLGKRCNYDCSYCSPSIHDWTSPHMPVSKVKAFVNQLDKWLIPQDRKFNIAISGGEPFIHPDIVEICKTIKSADTAGDLFTAITNGSMPLDLYKDSLKYLNHLTISLHLERTTKETEKTLETARELTRLFPDHWINVQIMCLPKKFDFLDQTVLPFLDQHKIKYTIRRIRPWINEVVEEWQNPKREILKTVYDNVWLAQQRELEKKYLDQNLTRIYSEEKYYTKQELTWIQSKVPTTNWQNIGLWSNDGNYFETNSDIVVNNNKNKFNGWRCWIGIDSIMIDFDGLIYKSVCRTDGTIGTVDGPITWPNEPTFCPKQLCISNVDQTVRKSQTNYMHLVTDKIIDSK